MADLDNWIRAEYELKYREKQIAEKLEASGMNKQEAEASAKQEIKPDIELRAYLIYCATKDCTLDNWLQAEWECNQMPDFNSKVNPRAQELVRYSDYWMDPEAARILAKREFIEFIEVAAYYIWENRWKMDHDWYSAENILHNKIDKLAQDIRKKEPYLSEEEARYCARDRPYHEISECAYYRQKEIAKRAHIRHLSDRSKPSYDNWCQAAQEYDSPLITP